MGDIQTHEHLSRVIIATFRQHWPHEENYGFFELGNWLTDMSGFIDPYAFLCAKIRVWAGARPRALAGIQEHPLGFATTPREQLDSDQSRVGQFADHMLGRPGAAGELAGFIRNLTFFIGAEFFRTSSYAIPPEQFQPIFYHFAQYYPHEHLDFPPWPHGQPRGNRDASTRARHSCGSAPDWRGMPMSDRSGAPGSGGVSGGSPSRAILGYLDDQIEYVAELLTWIEHEWIRVNAEPDSPNNRADKRRVLALWGHASHAIEDFFFHSNFVEFA